MLAGEQVNLPVDQKSVAVGGQSASQQEKTAPEAGRLPAPDAVDISEVGDGVNDSSATNPDNITIKGRHREHKGIR